MVKWTLINLKEDQQIHKLMMHHNINSRVNRKYFIDRFSLYIVLDFIWAFTKADNILNHAPEVLQLLSFYPFPSLLITPSHCSRQLSFSFHVTHIQILGCPNEDKCETFVDII